MVTHFDVGNITVPAYSLIIIVGCVLCGNIALYITKKYKLSQKELLLLGVLGSLGALIGAKLLSSITNYIEGGMTFLSIETFRNSGFSYYGGLAGFLFFVKVASVIFKIELIDYEKAMMFLFPGLHCIWKVGCFMGGCCFGIPYHGIASVCFPPDVNALSGTMIFPVQLLEAIVALVVSIYLFFCEEHMTSPCATYLILYGSSRFLLEFLRYHENNNAVFIPYILSVCSVCIGITIIYRKKKGLLRHE